MTEVRAGKAACAALCGFWFVFAAFFVFVGWRAQQPSLLWVAAVSVATGLYFGLWLARFRVVVDAARLHYTDGFHPPVSIARSSIGSVRCRWVTVQTGGRRLTLPRIDVSGHDGGLLLRINPKPFPRELLPLLEGLVPRPDQGAHRSASDSRPRAGDAERAP